MAKLTHDEMFLIIDQVSEWLEDRLGQDVTFKRGLDSIAIESSPKRDRPVGQHFLPGFERWSTETLDWDERMWRFKNGRSVSATHVH